MSIGVTLKVMFAKLGTYGCANIANIIAVEAALRFL